MNHERYVEQFFQSLLGQTYDAIEIIYLDNCSKDQSATRAVQMLGAQSRFPFKVVERRTPQSLPLNLTEMETHASGELLCVISCDDWFAPDAIERLVHRLLGNPRAGMVYNRGWNYLEATGELEPVSLERCVEGRVFDEIFIHGVVFPPGLLICRTALKEVGGWDTSLRVEDYDLWLRMAQKYEIAVERTPAVYYRRHPQSFNRSGYRANLRDYLTTVDKYRSHPLYKRARDEFFAHELQYTFDLGQYAESIRLIIQRPRLKRSYLSTFVRSTMRLAKTLLRQRSES